MVRRVGIVVHFDVCFGLVGAMPFKKTGTSAACWGVGVKTALYRTWIQFANGQKWDE